MTGLNAHDRKFFANVVRHGTNALLCGLAAIFFRLTANVLLGMDAKGVALVGGFLATLASIAFLTIVVINAVLVSDDCVQYRDVHISPSSTADQATDTAATGVDMSK